MDRAVLYLDTCVLLDMFRDPARDDIRIHEHESSMALLEAAITGETLDVCIAEQVAREFRYNEDTVQSDAERKLLALEQKVERLDNLAALHGSPGKADLRHWRGLIVNCRRFAERWMQAGSITRPSDAAEGRAARRVVANRAPARKGSSSSLQDSLILETCLEHLQALRSGGGKALAVFVSSNTRDYAAEDQAKIREDIEREFHSLDLRYAPNMGAARGLLGV